MQDEGQPFLFNFGGAECTQSAAESQPEQPPEIAGVQTEEISTDAEVICCICKHHWS